MNVDINTSGEIRGTLNRLKPYDHNFTTGKLVLQYNNFEITTTGNNNNIFILI